MNIIDKVQKIRDKLRTIKNDIKIIKSRKKKNEKSLSAMDKRVKCQGEKIIKLENESVAITNKLKITLEKNKERKK